MKKQILILMMVLITFSVAFSQRTLNPDDVKELNGTIISVNHPIAIFKADDGTEYEVRMGPYWYWIDNNYKLEVNTTATIKGEVNSKYNEIYPFEIIQSGNTIKLADENGLPLWSRGGKNWQGKGFGWRHGRGWGHCYCCCWRWKNSDKDDSWQGRGRGWGKGYGWRNCPYRNR
ncbi:MAG: hypothetical protein N2490_00725 [Ignavibacteria bacterium]|nr:hypothetical protein [Ignavibacteria bacterium]